MKVLEGLSNYPKSINKGSGINQALYFMGFDEESPLALVRLGRKVCKQDSSMLMGLNFFYINESTQEIGSEQSIVFYWGDGTQETEMSVVTIDENGIITAEDSIAKRN